jgi:hypothetical protein
MSQRNLHDSSMFSAGVKYRQMVEYEADKW